MSNLYVFSKIDGQARGRLAVKGVNEDKWVSQQVSVAMVECTFFPKHMARWFQENGYLQKGIKKTHVLLPSSRKQVNCDAAQLSLQLGDDRSCWTPYLPVIAYFCDQAITELNLSVLCVGAIGSKDIARRAEIRNVTRRVELRWKDSPARRARLQPR